MFMIFLRQRVWKRERGRKWERERERVRVRERERGTEETMSTNSLVRMRRGESRWMHWTFIKREQILVREHILEIGWMHWTSIIKIGNTF
jgi:hypothetical protein